jgi:hypothetical protein
VSLRTVRECWAFGRARAYRIILQEPKMKPMVRPTPPPIRAPILIAITVNWLYSRTGLEQRHTSLLADIGVSSEAGDIKRVFTYFSAR